VTEPLPDLPPTPPAPTPPKVTGGFAHSRFHFMTGIPGGETANVRDDSGAVVLSYRSFASVVGIIAALVAGVVAVAGTAGVLFLLMEKRPIPAAIALVLCAIFTVVIILLVPRINATIYEGVDPALTISQQSSVSFPVATYVVTTIDGKELARLRKSFFSRFGRNRWTILPPNHHGPRGEAIEESLGQALMRKVAGKFSPRYQSNVRIRYAGSEAGWIIRRPNETGDVDVLDLAPDAPLDRRVAVALAALVLGSEP
jgi:hypothetical protein